MKNIKTSKALDKARKICGQQEQCSHDIRLKLMRWGIGSDDSEKIISILIEEKFIDEVRYCELFVMDKFRLNKWGRKKIEYALRGKNISATTIASAVELIGMDEYIEVLKKEIKGKRRGIKAKNQFDLKGKLFRFAQSRGFESNLIYEVLDECLRDKGC